MPLACDARKSPPRHGSPPAGAPAAAAAPAKKPRVSFASTVRSKTFDVASQDPKQMSAEEQRMLSPLNSSVQTNEETGPAHPYNEDESTAELRFPGIRDLCATPEQGGRRGSIGSSGRRTSLEGSARRRSLDGSAGSTRGGAQAREAALAAAAGDQPGRGRGASSPAARPREEPGVGPPAAGLQPRQPQTPVRAQCAGRDESDSDDSAPVAGEHTTEITGDIMSLSGLVKADEEQAECAGLAGQPRAGSAGGGSGAGARTLALSPASSSQVTGNIMSLSGLVRADEEQSDRAGLAGQPRVGSAGGGGAAGARTPALSPASSSQVTGNIMSLTGLVKADEEQSERAGFEGQPRAGSASGGRAAGAWTPALSPAPSSQASPALPKKWDLYRTYQESGGGVGGGRAEAGCAAPAGGEERWAALPTEPVAQGLSDVGGSSEHAQERRPPVASPERRSDDDGRRLSPPDTVDMRGFVSALDGRRGDATFEVLDDSEQSEVPEGRRSFLPSLPKHTGEPVPELRRVATPSRSPRGSRERGAAADAEGSRGRGQAARQALRQEPKASPCPAGGAPRAVAAVLMEPSRGAHDREALGDQVPELPTFSKVGTPDATDGLAESSLLGQSEFVPILEPGAPKGPPDRRPADAPQGPVHWDQFLSLCGISFPTEEAEAAHEPGEQGPDEASAASCESSCPQVRRLAGAHDGARAERLGRALRELTDSHQVAQREYAQAVGRWNCSRVPQGPAAELLQAQSNAHELEALRARVKCWQGAAKDQAWLGWYGRKRAWLREDLGLAEEHTRMLQEELAALTALGNQLEGVSRGIGAALQQQRGRGDIDRGARMLHDLEGEELQAAQRERDFMRRKAPEAQAGLEAERQVAEDLARRLEEARAVAARERDAAREAQLALLQQRARRVELQRQNCLRTCRVSRATATRLDFTLRGNARVSMQAATDGSGSVCATLEVLPVASTAGVDVRGLREQLFQRVWSELPGGAAKGGAVGTQSRLEAVVPSAQVPRVLRRLDSAAVRIADQLQALRELRKSRPEATRVAARAEGGILVVSAALVVSRSHAVTAGPGGIVELARAPGRGCGADGAATVDATECVVEFGVDLAGFPAIANYSDISARQVFGRAGAASAVAQSLQRQARAAKAEGGGSLAEFLSVAVEAMRQ